MSNKEEQCFLVTSRDLVSNLCDDTTNDDQREWHSLSIVGREDWRRTRLSKMMVMGRRRAKIRGAIPLGLGIPMSLPTVGVSLGLVVRRVGIRRVVGVTGVPVWGRVVWWRIRPGKC